MSRTNRPFQHSSTKNISIAVALIVSFVVLSIGVVNMYKKYHTTRLTKKDYYYKYQQLESEYQNLKTDVEYLETTRGLEEEIREKFRVTKEGEQMIIILDDPLVDPKSTRPKGFYLFGKKIF